MLKVGLTMVPGTLAISGYNLVNAYFIGRLPGEAPMAAIGFTLPVVMLLGCVIKGLGGGVMAPVAQALGNNKHRKANRLVTAGIFLGLLLSVIFAVVGIATGDLVFRALGAQGETLEHTLGYMHIWYLGVVTAAISMFGNDLMIAAGRSRIACTLMIGGMLFNAVLDPMLIFGWGPFPEMGIRGAALGTVISQLLVAVAALAQLRRLRLLTWQWIPLAELRMAWAIIFRYGIPSVLGALLIPLNITVSTRITANFGDVAVAAVTAAGRLETIAFIFPMALGISLSSIIGQNYGARLYSRIRQAFRLAVTFSLTFLSLMGICFVIFAPHLVKLFSTEASVQAIMIRYMHVVPWGFCLLEIVRFSSGILTGSGHPRTVAILNGLRILGFLIPFSLLAMWMGSLTGLFYARLAADALAGSIAFLVARQRLRQLPHSDGRAPVFTSARAI